MKELSIPQTIKGFIKDFEVKFRRFLAPVPRFKSVEGRPSPQQSAHFTVYIAETNHSDWDLHCRAKQEPVKETVIKSMNDFVREYPDLLYSSIIVAPFDVSDYHNLETKKILQIMAFIKNTHKAPFFDFNVHGVPNQIIKEMLTEKYKEEWIDWMILTYWRKLSRNNDAQSLQDFLSRFILPGFDKKRHDEIVRNPISFFRNYLLARGYSEAVNFLDV